jgi:tetratricopeptide (TPR) repeat protein
MPVPDDLTHSVTDQDATTGGELTLTATGAPPPTGVGRYELGDELARGGMGVVYRATDTAFGREVAVKVLQERYGPRSAGARRFADEARITARLQHPAIPPVHDMGTLPDGRPFLAMKLIHGRTLAELLAGRPDGADDRGRFVAVFEQICQAVGYAHAHHVIHRDLKPANVMVGAFGEVQVMDWGLAKILAGGAATAPQESPELSDHFEPPGGEDAATTAQTVTGSVLGTPAYMPPEQAAGEVEKIDARSDVFGLGAILAVILTGKPPFVGDTAEGTRQVAAKGKVADAFARLDGCGADQGLVALCKRCLCPEQAGRPADAGEVAKAVAELRQAADERARRAERDRAAAEARSAERRKRRRVMLGAAAVLALAVVGGLASVLAVQRRANADLAAKNAELAEARDAAVREETAAKKAEGEARTARTLADQNAQVAGMQATLALNTIQDLILQVSTKLNGPGLLDFKKSLLDTALARVDGVAQIYEKSTSKEATALAAQMELAKIYRQTGRADKAYPILKRCLEVARERVKIKNNSDPSRKNLAAVYFELAFCAEEFRRDMKESLNDNREALKLWEDIEKNPKLDDFPIDRKEVRAALAEAYTRIGTTEYRLGDVAAARENYRKAYALRLALVGEQKDNPKLKQDLSYSSMALAETSYRLGDPKRADEYYREALELREAMSGLKPKDPTVAAELAAVNYMIGEFKLKTGNLAEARKRLDKCKEIRESLVKADDKNAQLKRDLAIAYYRLGNLADREKDDKTAFAAFDAARHIEERLVSDDPGNDKRQIELMMSLAHVGQVDRAAGIAESQTARPSADNELRIDAARTFAQCARHAPADQTEKAHAFQVKAVDAIRAAIANGFKDRVYLESDPDLDPLRSRDDFKELLATIAPEPSSPEPTNAHPR